MDGRFVGDLLNLEELHRVMDVFVSWGLLKVLQIRANVDVVGL